ncbi:MAG: aldehyde ferredoxin oxidoreductase family protein [Anaerosomatales bacterium]|nr:aldehyde ferredoxin oxidoreductase family protein [Anaerosomatales bacterium]MDT8433994.1 aldehyde ferredoxin oxidoreductase family protein [Anaerosomatales bacterium]
MDGNWNTALIVDLGTRTIERMPVPDEWYSAYIGGEGTGVRLFADLVDFDKDPLDPSQPLIFSVGPLTATAAPSSGRTVVIFRSVASGGLGLTNVGGKLAPPIKKAGYDMIAFTGRADGPVYVVIDDDDVRILDAADLWGKGVRDTEDTLKASLEGDGWQIASIGPAGENGVVYSCIITDKERAAGRSGGGVAMGSKNLKAVVVRGTKPVPIADPDTLKAAAKHAREELLSEEFVRDELKPYGTPSFYDAISALGLLPTKNWQRQTWPESIDKIGHQAYHTTLKVKPYACSGCPIACGRETTIMEGPYAGESGGGPEYETLGAFGAKCLVDDVNAIAKASYVCNDLGMDTISAGQVIAVAMEWWEKGILTDKDTDGLDLTWGNGEIFPELLHKIAYRDGFGGLLADGARGAAKALGGDAGDYAMHVKGLELASCGVAGSKGEAVSHAVSPRGADHLRPYASVVDAFAYRNEELGITEDVDFLDDGNKAWVKPFMELSMATNQMGVCLFTVITLAVQPSTWAQLLTAATGESWTKEDLLRSAERVIVLERLVNARFGFTRADDSLPKRLLTEPAADGRGEGQVVDLDKALDSFYTAMGWDLQSGLPTDETLQRLGMSGVV